MSKLKIILPLWLSLTSILIVTVGSLFWPWLGLFIPALLILAVLSNFLQPRFFCRKLCPRAKVLSWIPHSWSRMKPLPKALYTPWVKTISCGFLIVCSVGQTARLWTQWEALGWFFWSVCILTLGFALTLALLYKPRAWCALCPVGTLQDTLSSK